MRYLIILFVAVFAGCDKEEITIPENFPPTPQAVQTRTVSVRFKGTAQDLKGEFIYGIAGINYLPEGEGNIDTTITVDAGTTVTLKGTQRQLMSGQYGQIEFSIDTNGTRAASNIFYQGPTSNTSTLSVAIP